MKKITVLRSLVLCMATLALVSCDNFLKGAETKRQLEEAIAYANATECTLVVKSEPASFGTFLSEGEKKCKVGYSIDLQFSVVTQDYFFLGLQAVSTNDNNISRNEYVEFTINNEEEAAAIGIYKITVKLLKPCNDILIIPAFEKYGNGDISIQQSYNTELELTGIYGSFAPSKGTYNLICGRSYDFSFAPAVDYEFLYWQIYDAETGTEIPDGLYLDFEDASSENATFIFKGIPQNQNIKLAIRPVVTDRPQIVSNAPVLGDTLSYKDSMIQVIFDHDMSPDSIYYTRPEIGSLIADGITEFLPEGAELDPNGKVYGYKKGGEVFFKNISIKDNKEKKSILQSYQAPRFETKTTLLIPADRSKIMDNYTQIMVSIDSGFFYEQEYGNSKKKPVSLAGSKKWIYQVNDSIDEKGPTFESNGAIVIKGKKVGDDSTISFTKVGETGTCPVYTAINYINKSKPLDVSFGVADDGAGMASSFKIRYEKVKDADHTELENPVVTEIGYEYTAPQRLTAKFNGKIDLSSLEDGDYRMVVEIFDKCNNPTKCYYFMSLDNSINMADPVIEDTSGFDDMKLKLTWERCSDHSKTQIRYKKSSEVWSNQSYADFTDTTSKEYTGLALNTSYDFEIKNTDAGGNVQTITKTISTPDFEIIVTGSTDKTLYFVGDTFPDNITMTAKLTNGKTKDLKFPEYFNFDATTVGIGKSAKVSYTLKGVTKEKGILSSYHVAAADAIMPNPVKEANSVSLCCKNNNYEHFDIYKFGVFPQSEKASGVTISTGKIYKDWYLGDDGYFYELHLHKYYKIEPIKWRVVTENYKDSGNTLLLAQDILIAKKWHSGSVHNYSETMIDTYLNEDFLNKAFSENSINKIANTVLEDSFQTKVFLLSRDEATTDAYGFGVYRSLNGTNFNCAGGRIKTRTDYAKTFTDEHPVLNQRLDGDNWWLRSFKTDSYPYLPYYVGENGYLKISSNASTNDFTEAIHDLGIVPAICISAGNLQ